MVLFLISFLLVIVSSYFLTSVIAPKRDILGLIYLFLIAFAQIVFCFEVLSLFTAINQFAVICFNFVFFVVSVFSWISAGKPFWSLDCSSFRNRVANSLMLDKSLMCLYVGSSFFIIVTIFLCALLPITNADAQAYHVNRSLFWISQGNLNHFVTSDVRNLCFPINSEILYSWVLLFVKKDVLLGFFSLAGYFLAMVSLYNIMGFLSFSTRRKLWVIFILSSLPCVMVQTSGTETDLIVSGLLLSSIFLFWYALKNEEKLPVFMSALAYALAIGTKTTAILAVPAVGVLFVILSIHYKKYRPFVHFVGFGILNFIIFASYNYVLNFLEFGNFIGSNSLFVSTKNFFGLRGTLANIIKYNFMFIDFTGFKWADYVGKSVEHLRTFLVSLLGPQYVLDGLCSMKYAVNKSLLEPAMGAGVLGIIAFLPSLLISLITPLFKSKSKKVKILFLFALMFLINVFVLSSQLAYMSYSVRFMMFFIVLSAPILGYSYLSNKNPLKYIFVFFALYYFFLVSTNFWARPFSKISNVLKSGESISRLRYRAICMDYEKNPAFYNPACVLRKVLSEKVGKDKQILVFMNSGDNVYPIKLMDFYGYKIDYKLLEDSYNIDFGKYDALVIPNKGQKSTLIKYYNGHPRISYYEGDLKISSCRYIKNLKLSSLNRTTASTLQPFQVQCVLNNQYLKKEHFKYLDKARVINLNPAVTESSEYFIYKKTD